MGLTGLTGLTDPTDPSDPPETPRPPTAARRRPRRHGLLLLLLLPGLAQADGIVPLVNVFHRETWLGASLATVAIVLIESLVLRKRLGGRWYPGCLGRSAAINLASSAVASVGLAVVLDGPFILYGMMSLVVPLFLITLATEIPLLHRLYRHLPLSWERACRVGVAINLLSYAAVFLLQFGLTIPLLLVTGYLDSRDEARWQRPELLREATGAIYGIRPGPGGRHALHALDPARGTWQALDGCPELDPNTWDVEGDRVAFLDSPAWIAGGGRVVVAALPGFAVIRRYEPLPSPVMGLALSPDGSCLAVLLDEGEAVAYRSPWSYWDLGRRGRLVVLSVDSGEELARAPRPASAGGLCWLPDGATVLFASFDDEALYRTSRSEVRGSTSHGVGYGETGRFARSQFALAVATGAVRRFASGQCAALAAGAGKVLVRQGRDLVLLDAEGREERRCEPPRCREWMHAFAPDARLALVDLEARMPLGHPSRLALLDPAAPDTPHLLTKDLLYRFDWSRAPAAGPPPP